LHTQTLTTRHKLQHDAQQLDYLVQQGKIPPERFEAAAAAMRQVAEETNKGPSEHADTKAKSGGYISLSARHRAKLGSSWGRMAFMDPARSMLPHRAVPFRPRLEVSALEAAYLRDNVLYFDNFLTTKALHRIRRFCLESSAFNQQKALGSVGAQLDEGFATPLLFQIAEELAQTLPHIFRRHRLRYAWAYKFDSTLQEGIDAHADQAAVNVNFWITPDSDNLDPQSGGLVIFKAVAPKNWTFEDFNNRGSGEAIEKVIEADGRRNITVQYQQNRVVVFDSSLFHQTDRFRFKPHYKSRRINVTLLFGKRSDSKVISR